VTLSRVLKTFLETLCSFYLTALPERA
jgi:hypothetical protein